MKKLLTFFVVLMCVSLFAEISPKLEKFQKELIERHQKVEAMYQPRTDKIGFSIYSKESDRMVYWARKQIKKYLKKVRKQIKRKKKIPKDELVVLEFLKEKIWAGIYWSNLGTREQNKRPTIFKSPEDFPVETPEIRKKWIGRGGR